MGPLSRAVRRSLSGGRGLAKALALLFVITIVWLQARLTGLTGDSMPFLFEDIAPPPNVSWVLHNATSDTLRALRAYVDQVNGLQTVHNFDTYGPLGPNDPVIVVQVHNRWHYLFSLLSSLKTAPGINRTLLVLSHDEYSPVIETLATRVTFCKMMQIFFPHAIQLHPNLFPGQDPKDCPRNIKKEDAIRIACNNANYPDNFGHYREAKFSQTKHHWWWKMNQIMDGLNITRNHQGPFILLEEDHYVVPDFLHVLRLMEESRDRCKGCTMVVLGTYLKSYNYRNTGDQAEILRWASSKHNMGMVMYRDLWTHIKRNCSTVFCRFDDYNWDWSLYRVSMACLSAPIQVMVIKSPRIFHIGECGVHHKGKDCSSQRMVEQARRVISSAHSYLFPSKLVVKAGSQRTVKPPKGNGGWGDIRDHQLCLNSTQIGVR
ncbi:alpha-1,6-mannosyl-glycoprotein 2-beta-N-acetylglucosaminyltransferase-like [Ornithodoros turicata]|uniref:alpha-1,6-mannosyl-glycoprotein 2-beta-N-acetylglucosaminyltransferase-like n=1 Tax=Ornithodoros turicata TaxID=34597 RepID=UPI003138AAED